MQMLFSCLDTQFLLKLDFEVLREERLSYLFGSVVFSGIKTAKNEQLDSVLCNQVRYKKMNFALSNAVCCHKKNVPL